MSTSQNQSPDQDTPQRPIRIGWREYLSLPEWGIERIKAKMDTGARTSAIHVHEIQELDDGRLRFEVVIKERPKRKSVWIEAEPLRVTKVKPSSGVRQHRFVVQALMRLGSVERTIELSLVSRKGMLCRMLVGRKALEGDFVIDPSSKYIINKQHHQPPQT